MTIDTIALLRELIAEKDARLTAINRRLEVLRKLVTEAETMEEISVYGAEVQDLGAEITALITSKARMQKEINSFYKPAA